jgi:hypothetical protein
LIPREKTYQGAGENGLMRSFLIYTRHQISLRDQIKEDEMGRHEERMGEMRNAHEILVGKPEGMRPFKRLGHRCEDVVNTDLNEIRYNSQDSSGSG